ncbi:LLM class flavin-dependent oxidoreductase [Cryptosporangium aurantiacum]|uniref:Flavin-dependent oxidoreductase, luciferase family (Includes alkanesulfonate monooxygenase SsuD and methylene tetrahydromethanopterin reductase) n=1 Tax=Cryptosporangium aurantiacum TaxID=134849 RepID=A0A1M7RAU6_9ACTN|nr:LLM class flavin-dependent oxidoreductase [Cryptosporangium aurantiacum]SHN43417.1 Flavin-dependent oxidoreductase, luciferase family (includes alkanesulfonate monooxygenase SsuD and methylene tetrahydromethanopterin reductase) [Cryptosporangium aurantiacum]
MPSIRTLAFLTPGNYPDDDPYRGLEDTLRQFEYGEELGYDGAWIRQRHLEHGVGSAAVFLAAAGQRTQRIQLGSAVIPIGYENPFRLAEDLATSDVLSRGRLQVGFSAGQPPHVDLLGPLAFDGDWRTYDLSYNRISRLADNLRGTFLGDEDTVIHSPGNVQRPRVQPFSRGLVDRLWYGGGSGRSAAWAGGAGLHLLTGNVITGEGTDDFVTAQRALIRTYRRGSRAGRVALGRVVVPFDSADATARKRYRAYAESRYERTLGPNGPQRILFARDLVGPSEQILEQLTADPTLDDVTEFRIELPYEFDHEDYLQILSDVRNHVAPALGWRTSRFE